MAAEPADAPPTSPPRGDQIPPCKRCGNRDWSVEPFPKSRFRYLLETIFAAPDVWIFQSESGGWPGKEYQRWTCRNCGRSARVS